MSQVNKLLVSPSPHIHSGDSVERNMYGVIIALIPAFVVSILFFGVSALMVTIVSILSCMLFEYTIRRFIMGRTDMTVLDGSAILTGFLLALNLPSNLPMWIVIIGALVAIGVGKMTFGGLGSNIFNPAILGRVFLLVSFPQQMTTWPRPNLLLDRIDVSSAATPLGIAKGLAKGAPGFSMDQIPDLLDMLVGQVGGSFGEVSAIALCIGFGYLLVRKIITWHIPVAILSTSFVIAAIMHTINPALYVTPLVHMLSGGMLLGSIYMATDYVTSPMSKSGMILYGVMIGIITMLIRLFGSYPEGMSFAILIMNGFTPLINMYMKPKLFGDKVAAARSSK